MAERMSDSEVTAVVRASNMPAEDQDILLGRALSGDPSSRFMVYGLRKRQGKVWDSSAGKCGAWVSA
jgi:hypothetical protein